MKQVRNAHGSLTATSSVHAFDPAKKLIFKGIVLLLFACLILLFTNFKIESTPNSVLKGNILKKTVPFKGKFTADLSNGVEGTGVGTHIGRFTFIANDNETDFPVITGTMTITAANGDQIFATHTGFAQDLGNGMLNVDFDNTITGGTGRFAGATGSFDIHVLVNDPANSANGTIDGTISF